MNGTASTDAKGMWTPAARGRGATILEPMNFIRRQAEFMLSSARFNVAPCGRRSGKTAIAKRRSRRKALTWQGNPGDRVLCLAPTHQQSKAIFWPDMKRLFPKVFRLRPPSESDLTIELLNGVIVQVTGFDKPERVEGPPIIHVHVDEFGNTKPGGFFENIFPALSETQGTADLTGVPEGCNHYKEVFDKALDDTSGMWRTHTWHTADVLPMYLGATIAAAEIAMAKERLDELTYKQEYEAEFITFSGRAYYGFTRAGNCKPLQYIPGRDLIFCFDFNVEPGIAVVLQEQEIGTCCIGEVYIPKNSNTPAVCRKLIADWAGKHTGRVLLYGDATGGARGTAKVDGSDWDLITRELRTVGHWSLGNRVSDSNPKERARVNAMNSRICNTAGKRQLWCDPTKCPWLVKDLENVTLLEGGSGEIDKQRDSLLTHSSDALGYYVVRAWPIQPHIVKTTSL